MALGTCAVDCTRREQRCGQPCVHAEFQRTRRLNSKPAATSSASSCRALPGKSRRRNLEHGFDHGPFQRMATTRQSGNRTRVCGELKPSKKAQGRTLAASEASYHRAQFSSESPGVGGVFTRGGFGGAGISELVRRSEIDP